VRPLAPGQRCAHEATADPVSPRNSAKRRERGSSLAVVAIKRMRSPYATVPRPFATPSLTGLSDDEVLDRLTVEHLTRAAYWRLWEGAMSDTSAVRRGLRHPDPRVRAACAQILDHFLDDAAIAEIVDCLNDDHPRVRLWALHTLGCGRCKEGSCRPGEDAFLPEAIRMLQEDPVPHVRAVAATTLGRSAASRRSDVAQALAAARDGDPDRHVREAAARFATA
jgi:HEAT repeat protein